jgi:HD-like signal output (HDOD) protein
MRLLCKLKNSPGNENKTMLNRLWNKLFDTKPKTAPPQVVARAVAANEVDTPVKAKRVARRAARPAAKQAAPELEETLPSSAGIQPPKAPTLSEEEAEVLLASFYKDLQAERFVLTSMPEVAIKIRNMLTDPEVEADQLSNLINLDPAIAAKLMRTANSALYGAATPCDSVQAAIVRLGLKTTRQLVLCYTMRDLFRHNAPELKNAMNAAWEHTVYVAAICFALAQRSGGFSQEQAMLAGMMSNVGVLSVYNFLGNYPNIYQNAESLEAAANLLRGEAGALVLERWEFSGDLVTCARHCQDWRYESEAGGPDLCDLVLVATLHALIGKQKIPRIDKVPAFEKISAGTLGPEVAANFLKEAKDDINEAKLLING